MDTGKKNRFDTVLKGGDVINVFTGEIIRADIAIKDGLIAFVGDIKDSGFAEVIDCAGKFATPGFIDAHMHFESTLVLPDYFVNEANKFGTTTFIADPHEAVNVMGSSGLDFMIDRTEDVEGNVFIMVPSCVPVNDMEENGYNFTSEDMEPYVDHPRVLGLGEVMDTAGVINEDKELMAKLDLFKDKIKDGHAIGLDDEKLQKYARAGITTDHEATTFEEAIREARLGMQVLIREGSGAKNLDDIVSGIVSNGIDTGNFSFCTDDKHVDDIKSEGHISYNIKRAIELGIKPVSAYQMATINTARTYGLKDIGAIAAGYKADIVILNDLEKVEISQVLFNGKVITDKISKKKIDKKYLNTINCGEVEKEKFELLLATKKNKIKERIVYPKAPFNPDLYEPIRFLEVEADIIEIVPNQILTKHIKEPVFVDRKGYFMANPPYNKIVSLERHHNTGHMGVGIVKGFNLKDAAIASSIGHDSHNIVAVGDGDENIITAIEKLKEIGGGYVLVSKGEVLKFIKLGVMGLMAENKGDISKEIVDMEEMIHSLGTPKDVDPFHTLSFISLSVIPEIRITSRGSFDVVAGRFI